MGLLNLQLNYDDDDMEGRYEVITEEVYDAHSSVAHGNCLIRDVTPVVRPAPPTEAEPEPPAAEQAQGTHNGVVPGSNVPESDWEVGDSGDCHQCGRSLSLDDCYMSEDLPGDLMLCESCITQRREEEDY